MTETGCCKKSDGKNRDSDLHCNELLYNCGIDVFAEPNNFQLSGVVCTIGPACNTVETVMEMIKEGMCIARFNFSHGTHDLHKQMMDIVRQASSKIVSEKPIALALDTKGPEIRTGINKDGQNITLIKDETITLTTDDKFKESSTKDMLYIDYMSLSTSIKVGQIILVADGNVVLRAREIIGKDVVCNIISGSSFGSKKNVCLPMVKTDLPALSEKDVSDLKFGLEQKVDIIFASFIRSASNVREIRAILNTAEHGKYIKIVSKIENYEGVHNIEEIIKESDGIMVARGDLGMDLPLEKVIIAQKKIIAMCNKMGRPVINATQMLESMIGSYRPTRAEVADVTNAILDGADAVMLSGESANGKYPVQAVKCMSKIVRCAETIHRTEKLFYLISSSTLPSLNHKSTAQSAVSCAYYNKASAIIVAEETGSLALSISAFKPNCPVISVSSSLEIVKGFHLYRALHPLIYTIPSNDNFVIEMENRIKFAIEYALKNKMLKAGSVIVAAARHGTRLTSPTISAIKLDEHGKVSSTF